jgi:hypothetical protein
MSNENDSTTKGINHLAYGPMKYVNQKQGNFYKIMGALGTLY